MARKLPPGITRTPFGFRASTRVRGQLYAKRFPSTATLLEMQDWRAAMRTDALRHAPERTVGTFAGDIDTYLAAVKAMPTWDRREQEIRAWLTVIDGTRARGSITSAEIRTALHQWRLTGRALVQYQREPGTGKSLRVVTGYGPLSASACNHRRTALMHFFSVLDGKAAVNPVRDVPKFREPDPQPRGVPLDVIRAVLDAMPPSKTKARTLVLAFTGIPPATLVQLTGESVNQEAGTVTVPRRRKGAGTKIRVLPLSPEALDAFQQMAMWEAWGDFSTDALRHSLHVACNKVGVPRLRAYDLRHSFGTAVYQASGDIRAVQALLDHSDVKLTERYTLGAVDARMREALEKLR